MNRHKGRPAVALHPFELETEQEVERVVRNLRMFGWRKIEGALGGVDRGGVVGLEFEVARRIPEDLNVRITRRLSLAGGVDWYPRIQSDFAKGSPDEFFDMIASLIGAVGEQPVFPGVSRRQFSRLLDPRLQRNVSGIVGVEIEDPMMRSGLDHFLEGNRFLQTGEFCQRFS